MQTHDQTKSILSLILTLRSFIFVYWTSMRVLTSLGCINFFGIVYLLFLIALKIEFFEIFRWSAEARIAFDFWYGPQCFISGNLFIISGLFNSCPQHLNALDSCWIGLPHCWDSQLHGLILSLFNIGLASSIKMKYFSFIFNETIPSK